MCGFFILNSWFLLQSESEAICYDYYYYCAADGTNVTKKLCAATKWILHVQSSSWNKQKYIHEIKVNINRNYNYYYLPMPPLARHIERLPNCRCCCCCCEMFKYLQNRFCGIIIPIIVFCLLNMYWTIAGRECNLINIQILLVRVNQKMRSLLGAIWSVCVCGGKEGR